MESQTKTTKRNLNVKAIGLSNFTAEQTREILAVCEVKPSIPQTEVHPYSQEGSIVIPESKNPDHIRANFDLFDFSLTNEEMAKIAALNKDVRHSRFRNFQFYKRQRG